MSFEWLQNIPDVLLKLPLDIVSWVVGLVGIVVAAVSAFGWMRANREKERVIGEERERLQRETVRFERQLAEQIAESDEVLKHQRQEMETRATQELEQFATSADEKVTAARQEMENRQQAAEQEIERARADGELQRQQVLQEADMKQEQTRQEMTQQVEQARAEAQQEVQRIREEAERRAQQAIVDANHSIDEAQTAFTSRLAETAHKHTAEVEQLQARYAADLAQNIQHHGAEVQRLQSELDELSQRAQEAARQRAAVERDLHEVKLGQTQRLNRIHRVWDEPPLAEPPRFLPTSERKTRFLSIANLKGGVGKTTIAGNAGLSLACRGYRVLLIDLDFQGSLSQVAFDRGTLTAKIKARETARAFFDHPLDQMDDWLKRIIHPVHCMPPEATGKCDIIAAWNDLADVELREEARWILQPDQDARYKIREILHRPEFCDRYDYVLFDCPPRLTTAAVNALAASDGVIVPIMLDWQSAAPILYMLRRLRDLKTVLTGGRVIGMVANQVRFNRDKPVQQMQAIFKLVCQRLDSEQLTAEDAFRVMVKAEAGIGSEVNAGRLAACRSALRPLFDDLVSEIERVTRHESLALV